MSPMAEEMEDGVARIQNIYDASKYLRKLLEDVSLIEHALIEDGKEETKPYEPTFFLYVFFSFNTLFNIDWSKSIEEGVLVDATGKEEDEIRNFIKFCFPENDSFANLYFPYFYDIVTMRSNGDVKTIVQAMKAIVVDNVNISAAEAGNCRTAFGNLLIKEGFTYFYAKTLTTFIYKVRCNIVHGTKGFSDLKQPKQRERIVYYSFFLIALQYMLFMRLDYLNNGYFSPERENFISKLRSKSWLNNQQTLMR